MGDCSFYISELETDDNERPIYPAKINITTVVSNPFDDIIQRETAAERKEREEMLIRNNEKNRPKPKKNSELLSFGADEDVHITKVKKPSAPQEKSPVLVIEKSIEEDEEDVHDYVNHTERKPSSKAIELQKKVEAMKRELKSFDVIKKVTEKKEKRKFSSLEVIWYLLLGYERIIS